MNDPAQLAAEAIREMIAEGAKTHAGDWRADPVALHIQKGARHGLSALLLLEYPVHCTDAESYIDHLKRDICRKAMALAILLENQQQPISYKYRFPEAPKRAKLFPRKAVPMQRHFLKQLTFWRRFMTIEDQITEILTKVSALEAPAPVDLTPVLTALAGIQTSLEALSAQFKATPPDAPAA